MYLKAERPCRSPNGETKNLGDPKLRDIIHINMLKETSGWNREREAKKTGFF